MSDSWKRIDEFCAIAFAKTLGPVPQGHGADGASTRFRKMKDRMRIPPGPGRFSLAAPGILITGREVEVDGVTYVTDLDSQDPRHDLGKMFGPQDSPIRDFFVGDKPASHLTTLRRRGSQMERETSTVPSSVILIEGTLRARLRHRS